jgi:hypothetical protein
VSLVELLWAVPLLLAVAVVLGVTGARGTRAVVQETRARFTGLALMLVCVAIVVRLLVTLFA